MQMFGSPTKRGSPEKEEKKIFFEETRNTFAKAWKAHFASANAMIVAKHRIDSQVGFDLFKVFTTLDQG
jgi:hypothetical protein